MATMRGILVREFGDHDKCVLEKDVPKPSPADDEVLIRVYAAGVNPVDTYIRSGVYPELAALPYTPGQDSAGVVEEVGAKVTDFKKGDRVFTVLDTSGTYAEYTTAKALKVTHLDDSLSYIEGAGIGVPYFTAYKSIHIKARAVPGETVLIHGASGSVGLASIQIAKAFGLRVLGTAGTQEGLDLIKRTGADLVFNHREEGYLEKIRAATNGEGVNIILEILANVNLQNDLTLLQVFGRVVVIGCRGNIEINPKLTMMKELTIVGVILRVTTDAEWRLMRAALEAGQRAGWLKPVIAKVYPLGQAGKAQYDIINNQGTTGKLIIDVEKD